MSFSTIESYDSPNEGRTKINNNFASINGLSVSGSVFTYVSGTTISGGTLYSGSTDLYSIFLTSNDGNDITRVQPGINIYTGGTANNPTINLSGGSFNNISTSGSTTFFQASATTFSGGTIYSGSTNLYSIFQPSLTISNGLTLAGNSLKWGGLLTSTTNITGNQTLNLGTTVSRLAQLNTFTSTKNEFFVGNSATTSAYSALGLYNSGTNYSAILQSTDNANLTSFELTPGNIQGLVGSSVVLIISSTGETVSGNGTTNTIVIDDPNAKGAVYKSDFTSNFTQESLVSKRYVDNSVTGVTSALTNVYKFSKTLSLANLATLNSVQVDITPSDLGISATQGAKFHQLDTEWWVDAKGTPFSADPGVVIVLKTSVGATAITHLPMGEVVGISTPFTVQSNLLSASYGSASVISVTQNSGFYLASTGAISGGGISSFIKVALFYEKVNF